MVLALSLLFILNSLGTNQVCKQKYTKKKVIYLVDKSWKLNNYGQVKVDDIPSGLLVLLCIVVLSWIVIMHYTFSI